MQDMRDINEVIEFLDRLAEDPRVPADVRNLAAHNAEKLVSHAMTLDEVISQVQQSPLNDYGTIDWLDDDFTD